MVNFNLFVVTYLAHTAKLPARIRIYSPRFKQTVVIRRGGGRDINDDAKKELERLGFNVVGQAEGRDCMYLLSDTFKNLQTDKNS